MTTKKELGQFYTTNYVYILNGMHIPYDVKEIIEPFTGKGDLLKFITNQDDYKLHCYDIDPKNNHTIKQDTLKNPPNMTNKFLLTNPPYLSRNKSTNKEIFDLYNENDLYKCFIRILITNNVSGGIIIIPLNFWSSIRKADINLRKDFLKIYKVVLLNIFEEQVFDDTSYAVCCFQFKLRDIVDMLSDLSLNETRENIQCIVYPTKTKYTFNIDKINNYTIGGEIYKLTQSTYEITRLTKKNKTSTGITNILVKALDDSITSKIRLTIVADDKRHIDNTSKLSERSYATLVITPAISLERQKKLIIQFNSFLEDYRKKYNSLFLSNFRESNTIARKRISFDLVYKITKHLLLED